MTEKLKAEIDRLNNAFSHGHVRNPDGGDLCAVCGLDLREDVHIREGRQPSMVVIGKSLRRVLR